MTTVVRIAALGMAMAIASGAMAEGWTDPGRIQQIHFSDGKDGILVAHANDMQGLEPTCSRYDYSILPKTGNDLFKEMYATLLAAHLAGQPLNLYVSGCLQDFPIIKNIISADAS